MTVSTLTLDAGSIMDFEFNNTPANDLVNITTSGGLTINGGGFNLLQEGTANAYSTNGTYNLLGYGGAIGGTGVNALSVLNPLFGKTYGFGTTGSFVTLMIADTATPGSAYWTGGVNSAWIAGRCRVPAA